MRRSGEVNRSCSTRLGGNPYFFRHISHLGVQGTHPISIGIEFITWKCTLETKFEWDASGAEIEWRYLHVDLRSREKKAKLLVGHEEDHWFVHYSSTDANTSLSARRTMSDGTFWRAFTLEWVLLTTSEANLSDNDRKKRKQLFLQLVCLWNDTICLSSLFTNTNRSHRWNEPMGR